jgi:hypothetical protein
VCNCDSRIGLHFPSLRVDPCSERPWESVKALASGADNPDFRSWLHQASYKTQGSHFIL